MTKQTQTPPEDVPEPRDVIHGIVAHALARIANDDRHAPAGEGVDGRLSRLVSCFNDTIDKLDVAMRALGERAPGVRSGTDPIDKSASLAGS